MSNSGSGLIGTAIGVGFGLYALGMLSKFNNEIHSHSVCPYCKIRSIKNYKKDGVYCSYCKRRLI